MNIKKVITDCNVMFVGTGDCNSILSFYNICGFTESHRKKNFFIDNYEHPMFEDGKQLVDMVYLKRERQLRIIEGKMLFQTLKL